MAGVEYFAGSLFDNPSVAAAAAGCTAVIHLVGIISEIGGQTFERVHVEGTKRILEAARSAGIRRFIHMSAMGARADAPARYHRTKWAAEEAVRGSGLDATIFRPSLIYGPGDGVVSLFETLSRGSPIVPVIGSGEGRLQPVAVSDVGNCFVQALTLPRTIGLTFELGGPDVVTFNQLLKAILLRRGRRRWIVHVPLPLARITARFLEGIFPLLLRRAPPLNRDQILMLGEDNIGDSSAAWREFNHQPVALSDGLNALLGPGG